MVPIPYNSEADSFVIFIGVISVLLGFLFIRLLFKLRAKHTKILIFLTLLILFWFIGLATYFFGLLSWLIENDRGFLFRLSLPLGYSANVIATFFTILFASEFLEIKPRTKKVILIAYFVYMVALVVSLFNFEGNQWGVLPPIPDYRLMNLVLMILGQIIVFSILVVKFRALVKRVADPLYKFTIRFILLFFCFTLASFILMVVGEVHLMLISNPPLYGPFEYVAWSSGLVGLICGYLGYIQPGWLKKRFASVTT